MVTSEVGKLTGAEELGTGSIWLSLIQRWVCCVALSVLLVGVVGRSAEVASERFDSCTGVNTKSTVLMGKAGGTAVFVKSPPATGL